MGAVFQAKPLGQVRFLKRRNKAFRDVQSVLKAQKGVGIISRGVGSIARGVGAIARGVRPITRGVGIIARGVCEFSRRVGPIARGRRKQASKTCVLDLKLLNFHSYQPNTETLHCIYCPPINLHPFKLISWSSPAFLPRQSF